MKAKETTPTFYVDGHELTFSFSPEYNNTIAARLKKLLFFSYIGNCTFAKHSDPSYDYGEGKPAP